MSNNLSSLNGVIWGPAIRKKGDAGGVDYGSSVCLLSWPESLNFSSFLESFGVRV